MQVRWADYVTSCEGRVEAVWMWEKCKRLSTGNVAPDASWLWNVASKCEAVTRS